jgi:hypothetical protein
VVSFLLPRFDPGQYLGLRVGEMTRSYSLTGRGHVQPQNYSIAVRRQGRASGTIWQDLQPGSLVELRAPGGDFIIPTRQEFPVVLIAGEGDSWKGSGRSVLSFDLHAGLAACADHLERFGGHRAAAGLTIRGDELEAFAAAFAAHADGELLDEDLAPVTRVDAIVPASALTLELARELEQLSPFGLGNPDVTLLVAGCEAVGASTVGEGKHLRFRVRQHGRDAGSAIAFGLGGQLERLQGASRFDVAFRPAAITASRSASGN